MSKPTPGPWEYGRAANYDGFYVAPLGTLPTLAAVERCGHRMSTRVHNFPGDLEANARLIAAAPELYESLKSLVAAIDEWEGAVKKIVRVPREYAWGDLEEARRAIARAEGRP